MKRPLRFFRIALLWSGAAAANVQADALTVVIENVESAEGTVMLQVMAGESEFGGESRPIVSLMQRAQPGELTFSTSSLPAGEYAVRVMHDRNDNGELDSNFVGMPKEPWAFSNNAKGSFGPPGWDQVKFSLDGMATQRIRLNQ